MSRLCKLQGLKVTTVTFPLKQINVIVRSGIILHSEARSTDATYVYFAEKLKRSYTVGIINCQIHNFLFLTLHLRDEGVGGKRREERKREKRKGREARKLPDVSTGVTDCARRYGWSVKPKIRYTDIT